VVIPTPPVWSRREGANVLNIKNEKPLRAGQVFTVSIGVSGLENADATDARAKTYALQVRG
jgi:nucleosome binding factor SPN SPT16 subunit